MLHQSQIKALNALNIALISEVDGVFRVTDTNDGTMADFAGDAKALVKAAKDKKLVFIPADEIDLDPENEAVVEEHAAKNRVVKGNIVPKKYQQAYGKNKHNGDALAIFMKDLFTTKEGVNIPAVQASGELNNIWRAQYATLNPGQIRMTVGNRLRHIAKKNGEVTLVGPEGQVTFRWSDHADLAPLSEGEDANDAEDEGDE